MCFHAVLTRPCRLALLALSVLVTGCTAEPPAGVVARVTSSIATDSLNSPSVPGTPSVDVGIYLLDTESARYNERMPVDEVIRRYGLAREVFDSAGVRLNLLWIRTVRLEPETIAIRSNVMEGTPGGEVAGLYEKIRQQRSALSPEARAAFEAIVERDSLNDRTVYLVGMEDVEMGWYEEQGDGSWVLRYDPTNALSFPAYTLQNRIPRRLRGVITVQNIFKSEKIIAHELGHKLINVSHEHREISPAHEVDAEDGLMVYGEGTEIASGHDGRWHMERLHRSPFLYIAGPDGVRTYNPDYREHGHYADPIYDDFVRFD